MLPVTKNIRLIAGSYMHFIRGGKDIYENSMFNSSMNPEIHSSDYYNYLKIAHEVINKASIKLKYNLQINYMLSDFKLQDAQYKDDFFKYGHIGKYNSQYSRSYEWGYNEILGVNAYIQNGFISTGVDFIPGESNQALANYMTQFFMLSSQSSFVYNNLTEIQLGGGLLNGDSPLLVGGKWNATGTPFNQYQTVNTTRLNPKFFLDLSIKQFHNISVGMNYNQSSISSYSINPTQLWPLMRMLTNNHIMQLDITNPHPVYDSYGVFQDTIWYDRYYSGEEQKYFDYNLRKSLGLAINGTDWIDIDSYDPAVFSLDMFSADELLNPEWGCVGYFGYDHTGKKVKNISPLDYFSARNVHGRYSRQIGAFKPVYLDGYIQYQYAGRKLHCTAGAMIARYDANQPMLEDPFLFYKAKKAGQVSSFGPHPANIGEDYVVYVDDIAHPYFITGYRNGFTWYNAQGDEISDPDIIKTPFGIAPLLENYNQFEVRENVFVDYQAVLNILPSFSCEYLLMNNLMIFGAFRTLTENPVNNNFRPDLYYYASDDEVFINNPALKPQKLIIGKGGLKYLPADFVQIEAFYLFRKTKGLPEIFKMKGAYPYEYTTWINSTNDFDKQSLSISVIVKKPGKHALTAGLFYERQLNEERDFKYIYASKNVSNTFVQYQLNKQYPVKGLPALKPVLSISLVNHFRSGNYYLYQSADIEKYKLPGFCYFDLKVEKPFYLGTDKKVYASIYLAVQNLLNRKNIFFIYPGTGLPDDDGFLSDPANQSYLQSLPNQQSFTALYSSFMNNPYHFDAPRMLILGCRLGL